MSEVTEKINALALNAEQKQIVKILLQKRDEKSIVLDFSVHYIEEFLKYRE